MQMAGFVGAVNIPSDEEEVEKVLESFPELKYGALGYYEITALQVASAFTKNGVTARIKRLVLYDDIINRGDQLGRTPLHYAALNGNADLAKFLLDLGASTECKLRYHETNVKTTPENYSKWNKLYTMLPPPDGWGRVPLHLAVKFGHVDVVTILIQKKANANAEDDKGVTPLLLAGSNKCIESFESMVEVLLKNGARVDNKNCVTGTTALFHAVTLNSTKATADLLKAGAWLSAGICQETELHQAAANGLIDILQLILNDDRIKKEDVNKADVCNRTPIYKAAYGGHKECLKLLIERGGDLGYTTKTNETIMDAIFAHIARPAEFVKDLLDDHINIEYLQDNDENFSIILDFSILAPHGNDKQMNVISNILVSATEAEKIEIFQHPLIETFLRLKWFKIRQFFFLLIYSYVFFVISLSTYIVLRNYEKYVVWMSVMRYFVIISSGGLMQHALIQLVLVPRNFFRQYEVWMNLTCTSLSLLVALIGNENLKSYSNNTPNWILHATSIAVLLAWTELMLLIGRLPTYGYYALMFAAVLQNVIKVLLTFVCLVLGFALSFSIQFYKIDGQFNDPWCSLVKTTVMMMGEFEYAGLFDEKESFGLPTTSRVIFLIFVILASIVLMNLMVGLAVSDIQGLLQEGYVRRLEKQAEFLRQLEKVISFKAIDSKWFPGFIGNFLKGKRCIATTFVIQSKLSGTGRKRLDKRLPTELVDSIKNIALKKLRKDEDQLTSANMAHLIETMKKFIRIYENKLEN